MELADEARAADNVGALEDQVEAIWEHLPEEQRSTAKSNVDVYLDNFISVVQGGPRERCQMLRHLFHKIYRVFCPNKWAVTKHKEFIYLKKLDQGDGAWSNQNTVLEWDLGTFSHLLRLPPRQQEKVAAALLDIPRKALSPCASGGSSWGFCVASPLTLLDRGACLQG